VLRPESASVVEQLKAYVEAEAVIFTEGSAVQSARLLGRDLGHIAVLLRRPGDRIAEDGLRPRSERLDYQDALDGVVCGLDDRGRPFEVLSLPIMNVERLLSGLAEVLPGLAGVWDDPAYTVARDEDVLAWLARSLESPRVSGRRSGAHILSSMGSCGLGHLTDLARSTMTDHSNSEAAASEG
jgi:hypothetical protein